MEDKNENLRRFEGIELNLINFTQQQTNTRGDRVNIFSCMSG